jgi:hypothetical protein
MIDVNELKTITKNAQEAQQREEENRKALQKMQSDINCQAEQIINEIPEKAKLAAEAGKSSVIIMHVPVKEFNPHDKGLWGVSKIVFDKCVDLKLNPAIGYNLNLDATSNNLYSIVINW